MIHLIYVSSATTHMSEDALISLLEQSRARNERQNITGMLLYAGGNFFKLLEGAKNDVEEIYETIVSDDRNTGNIVIINEKINKRSFPEWSMGFKYYSNKNINKIKGYSEFLDKDISLEDIAGKTNDVLHLLFQFKQYA